MLQKNKIMALGHMRQKKSSEHKIHYVLTKSLLVWYCNLVLVLSKKISSNQTSIIIPIPRNHKTNSPNPHS